MKKLLLIYLFLTINNLGARDIYEINREIEQTYARLDLISRNFGELYKNADEALKPLYEYAEEPDDQAHPNIDIAIEFIEKYMDRKTTKFREKSLRLTNQLIDLEAEKRILRK